MNTTQIQKWYDRNPVDVVLVVSFSLLLIFGWGQLSSLIGWVILSAYLIDRGLKFFRGEGSTEQAEEDEAQSAEEPLQELRNRYARGEIGDDEFERKLDRLVETESVGPTEEYDDSELVTEKS